MRLILARHGNTFAPGDKVRWVGAGEDLPLVASGVAQAERAGRALALGRDLAAIYCAPLKRTRQFAQEVLQKLSKPVQLLEDQRLTELDYGDWGGLDDAEIAARFGREPLEGWNQRCLWSDGCNWGASEESIQYQVKDFVNTISGAYREDESVLAVTSNGRLRYFLKLVPEEFASRVESGSFKVATGRLCVIKLDRTSCQIELWNEEPEALLSPAQS